MTEAHAEKPSRFLPFRDPSRRRRLVKVAWWLVGVAVVVVGLNLVGIDVPGWIGDVWDSLTSISLQYLLAGYVLQTAQTTLTALGWYFILRAGFGEASPSYLQTLAAYAAGVALNGFLPANIGTLVMLLMFVAMIRGATFPGVLGAMVVQKIFFTVAGTAVYLYLFLSVPGSFELQLGGVHDHPLVTALIVGGGIFLLVVLGRVFWQKLMGLWEKAKHGGAILARPRDYAIQVVLPSLGAWLSKLGVTAVFLAAYGIPVTFHTVMSVIGGNSLANTVSATPGGVGVNQAINAASLSDVTTTATATAYSIGQQLAVTAWNIAFGVVVVVWAFGWTGGKLLVTTSYEDAK
ncbi:MAG TPA: lysylphosphatidylglycerol synthase transmembrane domain-containing protein, partial [Gaiellaceae bacterium]|nr:lysylphosphatidylglycerol synthase transmembrane domain-containing protein [Gaiellaceae bacterium]